MSRRAKIIISGILVVVTLLVILVLNLKIQEKGPYQIFPSPDGKYQIEVYGYISYKNLLPVGPGQGGDKEGVVILRHNISGKILERCYVEMLQLINAPEWSDNHVRQKFAFDWEIPLQ